MLDFDEAIERLAALAPVKAQVVKLRCFAGLDREQHSHALGVSLATVDRHWAVAKLIDEVARRKLSEYPER